MVSMAAAVLFAAGWGAARWRPSAPAETAQTIVEAAGPASAVAASAASNRVERAQAKQSTPWVSPEVWQLVRHAQAPARTPELLRTLEQWTSTELQPEHVAVFQQIMEQGDHEECNYVFSLLEQREEIAGVTFLVKQLDHTDQDIRDRALMACEAMAGRTLSSADDAKQWAKNWTPDPAIAELFRREHASDAPAETSLIGPRKNSAAKAAEKDQ